MSCDFQDCKEFPQWLRRYKGKIFKFCTKHYAELSRRRWGKPVDESKLTDRERWSLWEDDYW